MSSSRTNPFKKHKYRAKPKRIDGIYFPSTGEALRYLDLKMLQRGGAIQNLKVHSRFKIRINGIQICTYEADFEYDENGQHIIEDFKGVETPEFKMKKKLMLAVHDIEIRTTKRTDLRIQK